MPEQGDELAILGQDENGTNTVFFDTIEFVKDLKDTTDDDLRQKLPQGFPQPGTSGIFITTSDLDWSYVHGELVRLPRHEGAWARKTDLKKIAEVLSASQPKTTVDKAMIDMLSDVTTYFVDMSQVKGYKIRLRKDSIYFQHDPEGSHGIEGTITAQDLRGPLSKIGLPGVAKWMISNGAKTIKPQKRTSSLPYYD
jgi:hypothetical protein